ncbi:unnamed protein product [Blumeria hordei]|uniref:SAC domain-containing protein n=1 Tax=Blumeria hordei TaxID=2867405 RepID=A0A383UI57_BLUHO|nr:unnamed protein product [Blumeria hordei]
MASKPFRDINVHASSSHYAFTSPSSPSSPTLVIDRSSGNIRLNDGLLIGGKRISSIAGILGIIKLRLVNYLDKYIIVITKAQPVGRLKGHTIYKVIASEFLPLRERPLHDHDEDTYLTLLKTFIKSGPMYFSYSLDLTNSFQRQSQQDTSAPLWKRADDRFFWNKFIQTDLIDFSNSGSRQNSGKQPGVDPFILPVIYGMLELCPAQIKGRSFTFGLITRRARHRAGTRYFSRGMDEQGNTSNYNETEQILILNDNASGLGGFGGNEQNIKDKARGSHQESQILCYVQTRGSVPLYWAEVNTLQYIPRLQIRGVENALNAALAHFDEQIKIYGDVHIVNLVGKKGREQRIKEAYEQLVKLISSDPPDGKENCSLNGVKFGDTESSSHLKARDHIHYNYFDFHGETKGSNLHRVQILLDQLGDALELQKYFCAVDMPGDVDRLEVRSQQNSVFRTNCMDCLDRTNVVQSILARYTLNCQLIDAGILSPGEKFESDDNFEFMFRKVWADNADTVSKSYSGTGALKTDLTRLGKRTKGGALQDLQNAISRYVKNNFLDGPKQDAFDLFLGRYHPKTGSCPIFMDKRPLVIQSIPYVLAFSIFFVLIGTFTPRLPDSAILPVKLFIIFWSVVGAWSINFIYSNGMLYVNWPKLCPTPWANDGYQETSSNIRKDKIIGPFVTRHERGLSVARYSNAEEGKKRIE